MWSPEDRGRARVPGRWLWPAVGLLGAGCHDDMVDQLRYDTLEASDLFEDGKSARRPPEGTVPRGDPRLDRASYSGIDPNGQLVTAAPLPVDEALLRRGQERYGIYCTPCHGLVGDGRGMIVLRGFKPAPTFHQDRLREQPIGYFVDVITNGFGVMPSYAHVVPVVDRWAIAAYVGALQLSQSARLSDLPAEDAARVEGTR